MSIVRMWCAVTFGKTRRDVLVEAELGQREDPYKEHRRLAKIQFQGETGLHSDPEVIGMWAASTLDAP